MARTQQTWTTGDEIMYIKNIGRTRIGSMLNGFMVTRKDALDGYKKSIARRKNWGQVNKEQIINFLEAAR